MNYSFSTANIDKNSTMTYCFTMNLEKLQFEFSADKNQSLIKERNISFEIIIAAIVGGGLISILEHPNKTKYPNQKIYVVNLNNYAYLVPFVKNNEKIFLKTIFPSRKLTKLYLSNGDNIDEKT